MTAKKQNHSKWLHIRLTEDDYNKIYQKYTASTCQKLSEYARRILLDKTITTNYRNQSLDDFMAEMIRLRKELSVIGNNYNQMIRKLHTLRQIDEFKSWLLINESSKQILLDQVEKIKEKINSIADIWLQ